MDTRPPTDVPAERPVEQTQAMPVIVDGKNGLTGLIPPHTTGVLQSDHPSEPDKWATGSFPVTPESPVRGVAVGVPVPEQTFLNPGAATFAAWMEDWARDNAPQLQAKAEQYGSNSLAAMGRRAAQLQGREISETEALELGCWLYSSGKTERITDAVLRGELPGRDSWHDLACYALMVLFIRTYGRWP